MGIYPRLTHRDPVRRSTVPVPLPFLQRSGWRFPCAVTPLGGLRKRSHRPLQQQGSCDRLGWSRVRVDRPPLGLGALAEPSAIGVGGTNGAIGEHPHPNQFRSLDQRLQRSRPGAHGSLRFLRTPRRQQRCAADLQSLQSCPTDLAHSQFPRRRSPCVWRAGHLARRTGARGHGRGNAGSP